MKKKEKLKFYLSRMYESYLYHEIVISRADIYIFFHEDLFYDMEPQQRVNLLGSLEIIAGSLFNRISMIPLNLRFPTYISVKDLLQMLKKNVPKNKKIIFISSRDLSAHVRRNWFGRVTVVQRTDRVQGIQEQKHGLFINPSYRIDKNFNVLEKFFQKLNLIDDHYALV